MERGPAQGPARPAAPTDYSLFDIPGVDNPLEARVAEMRKSWVFPLPELNAKLQSLLQPATQQVSLPPELSPAAAPPPPATPVSKPPWTAPLAGPAPAEPPGANTPAYTPKRLPPKAEESAKKVVAAEVAPPPPPPIREPEPVPFVQAPSETRAFAQGSVLSQAASQQEQVRPVLLLVGGLLAMLLAFFVGYLLFPH
jgi:hypothetical protein